MRRYIIWILFSVLLASCASDDYVDVIPGESIALLSIDCQQGESTSSGTNVLQALLAVEGLEDAGLDFSSKVYLFETTDGTFGLCAKVDSKKALTRLLEQHFVASRRCQQLTERKGYQFTVLDDSWLIGFSSDALLVMGPTIKGSSEQAQLQQRMAKYLDADEETGIRSTGVFERLGKDAPVCMVVQMDALPEAAALPLMIGAPKEADASQVWLSAAVTNADGCLEIAGDVFSFNTKIDEALKKSFQSFRPVSEKYVGKMWKGALLGLFLNGDGKTLLPMLQANKGLQALLAGMNTAIDMDNILRSVDGDVAAIISGYENDKPVVGLLAQLAHTDWLKDVDYWKRSCPAGTAIRDKGPQAFCLDLNASAPGTDIFPFGVADGLQFYGGLFHHDGGHPEGIPVVKETLPSQIQSKIEGKKMALVLTMAALKSRIGAETFKMIESVVTPLFGDVTTIIYTMK